ncbi:MAG: hypothetical protein AAF404_17740 [Pseudomonadota bacterium]
MTNATTAAPTDNPQATPQVSAMQSPNTAPQVSEHDSPPEKQPSVLLELFRKYASLSDLLRYGGALSVAVAMALFLVEGAQAFNDLQRFFTMLGFTAALSVAGFLSSLLLKEQRGSRVFVALALLSVPVNFTVFGALLYSVVPLDGMAVVYPGFAEWQAASLSELTMAIGAGVAVLLPVVWLGYTVLARSERQWLSAALVLSSAALVIPVRQELMVAVIALLAASTSWWFIRRYGKDSLVLKTAEGKFASTLLFIAPLIIVGRSMFLYEASGALLLMLSGGTYFATRQLLASRTSANWFTAFASVFALTMTFAVGASIFAISEQLIDDEFALLFSTCAFLLINYDLARVSVNKRLANTMGLASVVLSCCLLAVLALFGNELLLTVSCIAVLLVIVVAGYYTSYPGASVIAAAALAAIGVAHFDAIWSMAVGTGWWGIAALGVVAIVAGSLIDRMGTVVKSAEA